jgi:hypothetical protein
MPAQMIRIMVRSMLTVARHPTPRPALLGLFACLLYLSACGTHVVIVNSSEVRLRLDEFSITPQNVQVHAGRIKFVAVNVGIETHDLAVEAEQPLADGDPDYLNVPMIAEPGQTIPPFKLTLKPGRYKLVDTVADHVDLGEYGTLIVVK